MKNSKNFNINLIKIIFNFIKTSLHEINPWHNIKMLHTNIRSDLLSGFTVAIIALPLALAFGEISRLGPIAGLWGAIAGGIIGGLFGGCMFGVSGPTAPKATQIATFMSFFVIGTTNEPDLIAAFSIIFLSGVILVGISLLKISRLIHFIPYPVIGGFMCGIGVIVVLTQINSLIGLETEKNIENIFQNFRSTIQNINKETFYVTIPSLLILILFKPIEKKFKSLRNIPPPLIVLIVGTSIAYFMNLNIPFIGDKMGLGGAYNIFSLYLPDLARLTDFIKPAFALAGLAILDSLLSCKVADNMTGSHHSSDRETFGQGMANMAAGLLGGVTTATATMRTVANIKFGGKTPLASIIHGLTLLAILLGLGPLVAIIPNACLAAILLKVGVDILDYRIIPIIRKLPPTDLLVFFIVVFVTIYEDLMVAVAIGVILYFIRFIKEIRLTFISKYQHQIFPLSTSDFYKESHHQIDFDKLSVSVLQPHGPLFFGSTESLLNVYISATKHKTLILDLKHVTMIDLSGVFVLEDILNFAKENDINYFVSNAKSHIKEILEDLNFIEKIGENHYMNSNHEIISVIIK